MRQFGSMIQDTRLKIIILVGMIALTVAIHYGWVLEHIFGHSEWVHALHSRFCYLPILVGAAWFGVRGGLLTATAISALILPYLFGGVTVSDQHNFELSQEFVEIFFYYVVGFLIGWLVDRELRIRRHHQETQLALERSHHLSMVGQMAAGVAHEIKNPLASIKGAVEILSEDGANKEDRDEFRYIVVNEIKRIDGTVKEFLEYARPREIKREPMNLSAALQASLRQIDRQMTESGLCVSSDIEPNIYILGDPEKIHQVVLNLVLNAAEASHGDSGIEIVLARNGRRDVHLTIKDHGQGIDPAHADKIFEPFYTTKSTGTGLGLAIVKSIIESHNGRIDITSQNGSGTSVRISLPLATETSQI